MPTAALVGPIRLAFQLEIFRITSHRRPRVQGWLDLHHEDDDGLAGLAVGPHEADACPGGLGAGTGTTARDRS